MGVYGEDWTVRNVADMEAAFGGAFVRARAELGASAFGLQIIRLPPDSGDLAPEHDHGHDGQEEVYVVLRGSGELVLPGESVALEPGVFVRVSPPVRRRLRSGADGLEVLAIGGVPGAAYTPSVNSGLGAPEQLGPTASSAMLPDGPPPQLASS